MDRKAVTSQLDRHQLLMDLATAVTKHVDQNQDEPTGQAPDDDIVAPHPIGYSSK